MQRRDFVIVCLGATVTPSLLLAQAVPTPKPAQLPAAAPVPWMTGLNPATPVPAGEVPDSVAEGEFLFFTPTQAQTLTRLSDLLLPSIDGAPGALAAGTPQFLDFLIGASPAKQQALYRNGLDWIDAEAQKQHHQPFAQINDQQADQLIRPWLRTWMTDHPPLESHADFVNIAHSDIRTATINSRIWNDAVKDDLQEGSSKGLYWSGLSLASPRSATLPRHAASTTH